MKRLPHLERSSNRDLSSLFPITVFLVVAYLLLGCQSQIKSGEAHRDPQVRITFGADLSLQLDPCRCGSRKAGGIHRMQNLLESWKENETLSGLVLYGSSFLPVGLRRPATITPPVREQSKLAIQQLNLLPMKALALSSYDLALGYSHLRELAKNATFPFLSSDLYSKATKSPAFEPIVSVKWGEASVTLMALSNTLAPLPASETSLELIPWEEAISKALSKTPPQSPVVLITTLSQKELSLMIEKFPQISIVTGQATSHPFEGSSEPLQRTLLLHPLNRVRSLVEVSFRTTETPVRNPSQFAGSERGVPSISVRAEELDDRFE